MNRETGREKPRKRNRDIKEKFECRGEKSFAPTTNAAREGPTMIANLKPYPTMKDSGVEWLGEVPEHWGVRRGKNLFRCIDIRSETGGEELLTVSSERGIVPRRSASVTMFKAESYVGYKLCWPGDLVINSLWAWARGLGVSNYYGIISTAYGVYRPKKSINSRFIHELVRSIPFHWELRVRSKGVWTSRLQLTDDSFLCAPFPLPPLPEQTAIVRFLDYIDRRVRRYIRAKQKLIKLLEEQKQAIIHRAVTRGLDPDVPLKPSGVEWLGDVPEHWEVKRLKNVCILQRGHDLSNDKFIDGLYPVYGSNGLIGYHTVSTTKAPCITVGRSGSVGKVNYIETDFWAHNTTLFVLRNFDNDWKYLYYLLSSLDVKRLSEGSAVPTLNRNYIHQLQVGIPARKEQREVVEYIERSFKNIDLAINSANREIELLREYRTRLIADVVTGKLDVREAAAQLPDEAEELESLDEMDAIGNGGEERADDLDTAQEEAEA